MTLYFVRHGETEWNVKKKIQGSVDIPLNENGRRQAVELAGKLVKMRDKGEFHVVRAYTSPQMRAAETARAAAEALRIPCVLSEGLKEMNMGAWEGLDWTTVQREFKEEYQRWNSDRRYAKTPEGESYNDLLTRAFLALSHILAQEQENVLVVTHSAVLMAVQCYVNDCPFEENEMLRRYKTKNAEVVELPGEALARAIRKFEVENKNFLNNS